VILADLPIAVVNEPMIEPTKMHSVADVGLAAVSPMTDVVNSAVVETDLAAVKAAASVFNPQWSALRHHRSEGLRQFDVRIRCE
jgi:hypothetical protein